MTAGDPSDDRRAPRFKSIHPQKTCKVLRLPCPCSARKPSGRHAYGNNLKWVRVRDTLRALCELATGTSSGVFENWLHVHDSAPQGWPCSRSAGTAAYAVPLTRISTSFSSSAAKSGAGIAAADREFSRTLMGPGFFRQLGGADLGRVQRIEETMRSFTWRCSPGDCWRGCRALARSWTPKCCRIGKAGTRLFAGGASPAD